MVEVELRDESWVGIRPIEPGDKHALLRGFERLSPESRYKRFLTPMETLNASQLAYLTEVDHRDHEAMVAIDLATGQLVAVGRYVRLEGGEHAAGGLLHRAVQPLRQRSRLEPDPLQPHPGRPQPGDQRRRLARHLALADDPSVPVHNAHARQFQ